MQTSELLARKLVAYCFEHDILTQHGMKGIREEIQKALEGADALNTLALKRIDLLWNAEPGTPDGKELNDLTDAVLAYERCLHPEFQGH